MYMKQNSALFYIRGTHLKQKNPKRLKLQDDQANANQTKNKTKQDSKCNIWQGRIFKKIIK